MWFVEASGSSRIASSTPLVFASIHSISCNTLELLWSNDGSTIFIQLLEFLSLHPNFDSSLKDDSTIPLHVNDYDVHFTIYVFQFQFPPPIVDHFPSLDFNVIGVDYKAYPDVIDYDFSFQCEISISWSLWI